MRRTILAVIVAMLVGAAPGAQAATPVKADQGGHLLPVPAKAWPDPTHATLLDVAHAGGRVVAVGELGIVLLSDDGGKTFRQAKSVPVSSSLTTVTFVDDRHGWAAGQWGVILATADGGETWTIQRIDTTVDQPLFSIAFRSKDEGWAAGLWSLLLKTTDGGKTWTPVPLPPPPGAKKADRNLTKLFFDRQGTIYVSAELGSVLRSSDDGSTWTYLETGYRGTFWTGLAVTDGTLFVAGLRGNLYRSTDGGASWRTVPSGSESSITSLIDVDGTIIGAGLDGTVISGRADSPQFTAEIRSDKHDMTGLVSEPTGRLVFTSVDGLAFGEKTLVEAKSPAKVP